MRSAKLRKIRTLIRLTTRPRCVRIVKHSQNEPYAHIINKGNLAPQYRGMEQSVARRCSLAEREARTPRAVGEYNPNGLCALTNN